METEGNWILEVKDLKIHFKTDEGLLKAVDGIDFSVKEKETLGIVGESGCGKSVTSQGILRITPKHGQVSGKVYLQHRKGESTGKSVEIVGLKMNSKEIRDIRGGEISMIFQEPMKAFSPIHTIGNQISEAILLHTTSNKKEAKQIAIDMLMKVGMSNPEQRYDEYPHQLSGGMRQRAMIAMALACKPSVLIADEPTTALDVTVQAQVLDLINQLKEDIGTSVIFITHDLGVIAEMADKVAVMYLGKVVEYTDVDSLFHHPMHPYTKALLKSIPSVNKLGQKLDSIEGNVPIPLNLPPGCVFYSRCTKAQDGLCNVREIPMEQKKDGHFVRCLLVDQEQ